MSSTRPDDRSPRRSMRERLRRPVLVVGAGAAGLLAAGCSSEQQDLLSRAYLPEPATREGDTIVNLWVGSWIAAMVVGVLVWGLILWAVVAYNRRRRPGYPVQTRYNLPIEILWTVVPFIMIGVLFFFTARDQSDLLRLSDEPDVTVNVVGFRWSWAFNYLDDDVYDIGIPATANAAASTTADTEVAEGYTGPTLYLPQNERVRFVLTAPDVIHSFYVPDFLMKMDMIPARTNQFEVTPTVLGEFAGKCAELCGVDHSRMLFTVKVVTREEYDARMAELEAQGNTGEFRTDNITNDADSGQGRTLTDTDKGRADDNARGGE